MEGRERFHDGRIRGLSERYFKLRDFFVDRFGRVHRSTPEIGPTSAPQSENRMAHNHRLKWIFDSLAPLAGLVRSALIVSRQLPLALATLF